MYRRDSHRTLYRDAARRAWERYRPSLLDMPIGLSLLRDPEVSPRCKLRALTTAVAVAAGLFGLQWLLAWTAGIQRPVVSPMAALVLAVGILALAMPLTMVRVVEPEHVVRARLRKVKVIPLKRQ